MPTFYRGQCDVRGGRRCDKRRNMTAHVWNVSQCYYSLILFLFALSLFGPPTALFDWSHVRSRGLWTLKAAAQTERCESKRKQQMFMKFRCTVYHNLMPQPAGFHSTKRTSVRWVAHPTFIFRLLLLLLLLLTVVIKLYFIPRWLNFAVYPRSTCHTEGFHDIPFKTKKNKT